RGLPSTVTLPLTSARRSPQPATAAIAPSQRRRMMSRGRGRRVMEVPLRSLHGAAGDVGDPLEGSFLRWPLRVTNLKGLRPGVRQREAVLNRSFRLQFPALDQSHSLASGAREGNLTAVRAAG